MRSLVLVLLPVLAASLVPLASAAADAPFAPIANVVDYVATKVVKRGWGPPTDDTETITHHAGWTRVDRIQNGRPSTTYFGLAGALSVRVSRHSSGGYRYLAIARRLEQQRSSSRDHNSFKTGEREEFLGQSCEVWNVFRLRDTGRRAGSLTKFSCLTDDGIELWHKSTGDQGTISSGALTMIERRTVQPSEVLPPADLLDLNSWALPTVRHESATAALEPPVDFEVVMGRSGVAPTDGQTLTKVSRRHKHWQFHEDVHGDGKRTFFIYNEQSLVTIQFDSNGPNQFKNLVLHTPPPRSRRPLSPGEEMPLPRPLDVDSETILGERCTWFDMMPGAFDIGLHQCRTSDGIPLKERRIYWGTSDTLEAVRLQRREIDLTEVLPPGNILVRKSWGLPE